MQFHANLFLILSV